MLFNKKIRLYFSAAALMLLVAAPKAEAQGRAAPGRQLDQLADYGKVDVGYYALRLSDGQVLASRQADRALMPASIQKVLTSAVALRALGEDFRYKTVLGRYGDKLIVIGDGDPLSGDPTLAAAAGGSIYAEFDRWAALLKQRGVETVDEIVLDDTIIRERRHPDWPERQHSRWYCAPASGLNFNDNCIDVNFKVADGRADVVISPQSAFIRVIDRVRAADKNGNVWRMEQALDCSQLTFTGRAVREGVEPVSVAVDAPTMLYGRVLADRLQRAGLAVSGSVVRMRVRDEGGSLPPQVEVLDASGSRLVEVLERMNKRSLNFMAECLLLRSDAALGGEGSYDSAARTAAKVLGEHYGLDAASVTIADGSGLSRNNAVTARAVTQVLTRLADDSAGGRAFIASLPVSGVDGTLEKRLQGQAGRVAAKTGTLNGVRTLAGYVLDEQGRPEIAFAILCNRIRTPSDTKAAMDALVEGLIVSGD